MVPVRDKREDWGPDLVMGWLGKNRVLKLERVNKRWGNIEVMGEMGV